VTEPTTAVSSRKPSRPRVGWIADRARLLAGIGADARDDEELRQKKALLVLLAVLILPVSVVWGSLYLALGSPVGVVPYVYFAVSLGSLVVFARTRSFQLLLVTQLLDILLTTNAGQMLVGGFLPSGGVGLWGILAPLGALVFLEVRQAVRWFVAFLVVFVLTGLAGEVFFPDADLPVWFTSTMLALNVIGTAFVGFTLLAQRLPPAEMVAILDQLFSRFDVLVERHGLEKIKTIGDCYMAAAGVPNPRPDHARKAALLALEMRDVLASSAVIGQVGLEARIGINSGPVVAGVIGTKRFLYDLWGDAVNTASRMESHGTPGEIQITRATYELLKDEFVCRRRGTILVKGKGPMETWYLMGSRSGDRRATTGNGSDAESASIGGHDEGQRHTPG
jgi:guanylate cyclase